MIDAGQELREHLRPAFWSEDREDRVLAAIQRRRRSHTLSTVAVSSALVAVAVALAIMWFAKDQRASDGPPPEAALASAPASAGHERLAPTPVTQGAQGLLAASSSDALAPRPKPAIRLDDGSTVLALGSSKVRLIAQSDTTASFQVDSGKVWFDVQPTATRTIEVRIADVRVQVLGTEFVVEKKGEEVFVWVQRGVAKVSSQGQEITLNENEQGSFPAHSAAPTIPAPPDLERNALRAGTKAPTRAAEEVLSVTELWSLADTARLEGKRKQAIQALSTLVKQHPDDARAALAAFTLGRLLLDAKANPRRVASAFEKARTLAPRAPLAEDALAREIDALWQANARTRAIDRTRLYERLFPEGRHIQRNRKQR